MANNYGVANTVFKPFSFEEMLKPALMATEAHEKKEAELNELLEDAALKDFNFAAQDVEEKAKYEYLVDRIKNAADQLGSKGLSGVLKNDISKLAKDYRTTLIPIQQQLAKRAELVAEQRKLKADNPNIRFTKDYSLANLKDITGSSTYDVVDLDKMKKNVGEAFKTITSNKLRDAVATTRIKGTDKYNVLNGVGYTDKEFEDAFNIDGRGTPDINSPIYQFYKQQEAVIDSMKGYDKNTKDEMKSAIKEGMRANAGKFAMSQVDKTKPTKGSMYSAYATPEIYSYDSVNPEEVKTAVVRLGNKFEKFEVLGFEKNEDGSYKKDKDGNNIPILGNKVDKPVIIDNYKTYEYNEDGKVSKTITHYVYNDGSETTREEGVKIDNPGGDLDLFIKQHGLKTRVGE